MKESKTTPSSNVTYFHAVPHISLFNSKIDLLFNVKAQFTQGLLFVCMIGVCVCVYFNCFMMILCWWSFIFLNYNCVYAWIRWKVKIQCAPAYARSQRHRDHLWDWFVSQIWLKVISFTVYTIIVNRLLVSHIFGQGAHELVLFVRIVIISIICFCFCMVWGEDIYVYICGVVCCLGII